MFHQEIFIRTSFFYSKLPKFILALGLLALTSERLLSAGPEDAEYFENRVRPLLADKCQSCHGSLKQQASLRLDTKAGVLSGGESGPAVVAGRLDESLLIQAVRREGLEMPPEESLSPEEVEVFEKWVRDGAYWPKESEVSSTIALGDQKAILEKAASHWAFMPIMKPDVPAVPEGSDVRNPIDAFIVAKLVEQGLTSLPAADPRTLLR